MMRDQATQVFVSHSSADFKAATALREMIRDVGADALLFHAPEITDPEELTARIHQHIVDRRFFIYLKSDNSDQSAWCIKERELVSGHKRKSQFTFRAEGQTILWSNFLPHVLASVMVFIECTSDKHRDFGVHLSTALSDQGFLVHTNIDLSNECSVRRMNSTSLRAEFDRTAQNGIYFVIAEKEYESAAHEELPEATFWLFLSGRRSRFLRYFKPDKFNRENGLLLSELPISTWVSAVEDIAWSKHHARVKYLQHEYAWQGIGFGQSQHYAASVGSYTSPEGGWDKNSVEFYARAFGNLSVDARSIAAVRAVMRAIPNFGYSRSTAETRTLWTLRRCRFAFLQLGWRYGRVEPLRSIVHKYAGPSIYDPADPTTFAASSERLEEAMDCIEAASKYACLIDRAQHAKTCRFSRLGFPPGGADDFDSALLQDIQTLEAFESEHRDERGSRADGYLAILLSPLWRQDAFHGQKRDLDTFVAKLTGVNAELASCLEWYDGRFNGERCDWSEERELSIWLN